MLWTIVVVLVVLWLLGFITATGGSLIHILFVIALVLIVVQLRQGKKMWFILSISECLFWNKKTGRFCYGKNSRKKLARGIWGSKR